MMAYEMEEGHKISIVVDKLDFNSQLSVIRDDYLLIDLIVVNSKIVNFPSKIKTDMLYYDNEGKLFLWEDINITPVMFKDGNKYHKIDMPANEGVKYNRRGNYRLYVGEDMKLDIRKGANRDTVTALIKDVSATGFAFVYKEDYDIGQKVTLHFDAGNGKIFDFPGKVVRKQYNENIKASIYGCTINDPMGIMRKIVASQQQKKLSEKNGSGKSVKR